MYRRPISDTGGSIGSVIYTIYWYCHFNKERKLLYFPLCILILEDDSVKWCSARFSEITRISISISINSRISTELDTGCTYNTAWAASELPQCDADVPKHDDVADYDGPHVWCTLALYLVFDGTLQETTKRTVFIYHSRLESPNVAVVFATCSLYSYFSRISYDHVGVGEVLHKAEEL